MPIFMKVADQAGAIKIKGDVSAESHDNWVEIATCDFKVALDEDQIRMSPDKRNGGKSKWLQAKEGQFKITKFAIDGAGPQLMNWMVTGDRWKKVRIEVCGDTLGDGNWRPHVRYDLTDVGLISYAMNMANANEGKATVSMTLEYQKLIVAYYGYDATNEMGKTKHLPSRPISVKQSE